MRLNKSKAPKDRRTRRAEWRRQIHTLAQSSDAKKGGYDRAERRRRARMLWTSSAPANLYKTPRFCHYMSSRIDSLQRGLMVLHGPAMTVTETADTE